MNPLPTSGKTPLYTYYTDKLFSVTKNLEKNNFFLLIYNFIQILMSLEKISSNEQEILKLNVESFRTILSKIFC